MDECRSGLVMVDFGDKVWYVMASTLFFAFGLSAFFDIWIMTLMNELMGLSSVCSL